MLLLNRSVPKLKISTAAVFAGLVLVFVLTRLTILLTSIEAVSWKEDLSMGTIAREMIRGTALPFWKFQLDLYSGESLIIGFMAIPFFKLLGPCLLALKMPTFLISLANLILTGLFIKRHFGRAAALWTVFFLTFCPPIFLSHFLLVQSGHSEALIFRTLMLISLYSFLFSKEQKARFLFIFGVVSGFAISFYYGIGVSLLACLTVWIAARPRSFFSKDLFIWLTAFLVGLAPLFAANSFHDYHGITDLRTFFPEAFSWEQALSAPKRLCKIFLVTLPRCFSFLSRESFLRFPLAYLYYALCAVPVLFFLAKKLPGFSIKKRGHLKLLFFLVHPILFTAIFLGMNIDPPKQYPTAITFRYFTPLLFSVFVLLGISLAKVKISKWALVPLLALSLFSSSRLYFNEPFGQGLHYKGYSYAHLATDWDHFLTNSEDLYPQVSKLASFFELEDSRIFFLRMLHEKKSDPGFSISLPASWGNIPKAYAALFARKVPSYVYTHEGREGFFRLLREAQNTPESEKIFFYKGMLNFYEVISFNELISNKNFLDEIPEEYRHWAYWHLGSFCQKEFLEPSDIFKIEKFVAALPSESKKWFYRGIGSAILTGAYYYSSIYIYEDYLKDIRRTEHNIAPEHRQDFYWGVGWRLRAKFLRNHSRIDYWISRLPKEFQEAASLGANAYRKFYALSE